MSDPSDMGRYPSRPLRDAAPACETPGLRARAGVEQESSGPRAAIDVAQLDPDDPTLRVTVTDSALARATAEVTVVLDAPPTLVGLYLPLPRP